MERVWESSSAPEAGGHAGAVSALAWVGAADDGTPAQLFSGSWDGTVKCWQAEKPQLHGRAGGEAGAAPLATLAGHASRVTAVEADPDGHVVVSTSADFTARIWRRYSPFVCLSVYRGTASDGVLTSLSVGRSVFVTGSESGGILVWPLRPPGVGVAGSAAALRDSGSSLDGPERVVVGGMGLPDAPTTRAAAEVLGRGPPARLTAVGPGSSASYALRPPAL